MPPNRLLDLYDHLCRSKSLKRDHISLYASPCKAGLLLAFLYSPPLRRRRQADRCVFPRVRERTRPRLSNRRPRGGSTHRALPLLSQSSQCPPLMGLKTAGGGGEAFSQERRRARGRRKQQKERCVWEEKCKKVVGL